MVVSVAPSLALRSRGLLPGLLLCGDGERFLSCPELTVHAALEACALPVTVSVALNSEQKSTLAFWWWWMTLKESPPNASPVLGLLFAGVQHEAEGAVLSPV